VLVGLLLGLGAVALALEPIPQGRDHGVRLVRLEVKKDRIVLDGVPIDTLTDTLDLSTTVVWPDTAPSPKGTLKLTRYFDFTGWQERMASIFRIDSGRMGAARRLMLLVAPDGGVQLADLVDLLRAPIHAPDTILLELPGGRRVRVRDRRDHPDSLPQPLRVVLRDSAFCVMDGGTGHRSLESRWLEGLKGLDSLRAVLQKLRSQGRRMEIQLVLDPGRRLSFASIARVAAELDRATGDGFELEDDPDFNAQLLLENKILSGHEWLDWKAIGLRKADVVDSAPPPDSSFQLEGMEHVDFGLVDPMQAVESQVRKCFGISARAAEQLAYLKHFPVNDSIRLEAERTGSMDDHAFQWHLRDFGFPSVATGHRLWIREWRLVLSDRKTYSVCWALYDNGRRTGFWVSKNREEGRGLANCRMDSIVRGKDGRYFLRMHVETLRPIQGLELAFSLVGHRLRLGTVRIAFRFLEGTREIRAEACDADLCTRKTMENAPGSLLESCNYREPFLEGWSLDWDELTKVATCVTRSPKAKVTTRKVTEPSYIERGWKDTPAN